MSEKRIFFAIKPDKRVISAISKQVHTLEKDIYHAPLNPVRIDNFHITLKFIGQANRETIKCLINKASTIKFEPLKLSLDCTGVFKRGRILWFSTQQKPTALQNLHQSVVDVCTSCNIPSQQEKFIPHVTITRKFKLPYQATNFSPIQWFVNHFYLMESVSYPDGVRYEVLHKF